MPPAGFKPKIPVSEWPQTYTLYGAATGTGIPLLVLCIISGRYISVCCLYIMRNLFLFDEV